MRCARAQQPELKANGARRCARSCVAQVQLKAGTAGSHATLASPSATLCWPLSFASCDPPASGFEAQIEASWVLRGASGAAAWA